VRKIHVSINSSVLEPWKEATEVLGISVDQFLSKLICYFGKFSGERFIVISEQIAKSRYATREQAAAVAERLEEYAVCSQLAGERLIPLVAAEPVMGKSGRWHVATSFLGPAGWDTDRTDDSDSDESGERWKAQQ
jgi:hypothetical protein